MNYPQEEIKCVKRIFLLSLKKEKLQPLVINLSSIASIALAKTSENDCFRDFLKLQDAGMIDKIVFELNADISPKIDCTTCGNCCKSLMINITGPESERLATHLQMNLPDLKAAYIEESQQGSLIMNKIPCHFLEDTKCSIYEHRFTECREFPHLHRPGFTNRLFGILMYYGMCPIIFNVIEVLKVQTGFEQ